MLGSHLHHAARIAWTSTRKLTASRVDSEDSLQTDVLSPGRQSAMDVHAFAHGPDACRSCLALRCHPAPGLMSWTIGITKVVASDSNPDLH